jgi:uncharacterized protein YneF (UPF0154 family)
MSITVWIGLGVAAWLLVAVIVGMWVGRMIRKRDEQVPGLPPRAAAADDRMNQHPDVRL